MYDNVHILFFQMYNLFHFQIIGYQFIKTSCPGTTQRSARALNQEINTSPSGNPIRALRLGRCRDNWLEVT